MSAASRRAFFALLATLAISAPGGDCDPYTRPAPTAASVDLTDPLAFLAPTDMNTNLCEAMT